jgi:F0F1-type ATP synthase membrane subunit b/b'
LLEAENKRMQAYEEAQLIIDRAKNEANYEGESILQLANDDAKMIYKNAKRDAKLLKQEIIKDNDKRINEIALSVCKTIIKKQITKKNNDRLIKDILNNSKKDGGVE